MSDKYNIEPGLTTLIREDWIAHGRDWTKPGFRAIAVYRFGVWRMKITPFIFRALFSVIYRFLFRFVRNVYGIELPYSTIVGRRVIIEHQHDIVIHGSAQIGDDCIIRQGVTIGNRHLHQPHEAPQLANRVNIGAGAKILGRVFIGEGASIGANAVIIKDVPSGATAIGNPATIIQKK